MSSESDVDEFYDAEEASPDKPNRHRHSSSRSPTTITATSIDPVKESVEIPVETDEKEQEFVIESEKESVIELPVSGETSTPLTEHNIDENAKQSSAFHQKQQTEPLQEPSRRVKDIGKRRKRLEEARRKIQTEDNEESCEIGSSVPSSQTSSLDGVCAAINSRPYATQEVKEESGSNTFSLGRVGHILGGSGGDLLSLSSMSSHDSRHEGARGIAPVVVTITAPPVNDDEDINEADEERAHIQRTQQPTLPLLQEPDLVASTKSGASSELAAAQEAASASSVLLPMLPPVAPPRRKRKNRVPVKPTSLNTMPLEGKGLINVCQGIPSPASTVESITKEFEHSLDLPSAIRGQYVVKPQDEATTKAEGPSCDEAHSRLVFYLSDEVLFTGDGSAIDPGLSKQLNMLVRTRTDSGKQLTDLEILEQVMVLNLDTGEKIPLSLAEDRLPRCINPLSLHIMRLTSEYVSNSSLEKEKESDEENDDAKSKASTLSIASEDSVSVRKKTTQIKRLINRTVEKTVSKIKSVADEVYHARHMDDILESSEEEPITDHRQNIKFKSSSSHKGPYEFNNLKMVQDLSGEHTGAVWTMKFSYCGRLLATVGQDHIVRIWVLKDSYSYFNDMRQKYNTETKISPTPSQESLASHQSVDDADKMNPDSESAAAEDAARIFATKPFCSYVGHTADLLDVSWSKNYFILSSSMDKTVRLWHISRKECLCCFQHIDFVTAIAFHPRDDRYFLSGSLDGKLRLWNIPDKKVALWNELDGQTKLITAASFCQNGKFAVVGTYDGRCIFYTTEQLKYYTQIHVRSTRGKNAKGRKISGIEPMPGEDKILVTSNDSRIRLYDLRDLSLSCKYKGYTNLSSQIRASFSHDGKCIVSGSENQYVYLWKTHHDYTKFSSARKDRNDYWEGLKAHNAVVTAAVFAPNPSVIFKQMDSHKAAASATSTPELTPPEGASAGATKPSPYGGAEASSSNNSDRYVLVTADFGGGIKVFVNRSRPAAAAATAAAKVATMTLPP